MGRLGVDHPTNYIVSVSGKVLRWWRFNFRGLHTNGGRGGEHPCWRTENK